jgi:hypothetical protein
MSDNISQQELYKDKCLYATLNILLSKMQRLSKRVEVLEATNQNIHDMYNKKSNPNNNNLLVRQIHTMNLKINEQAKVIKQYMGNKEPNTDVLTTNLDSYLKDIDDIMEFKISNPNDFEKLKN